MDQKNPPTLPVYHTTQTFPTGKQQGILNKALGKMLSKKMPRLMNNPKIHSQTVKLKHKKKNEVPYY